MEKVRKFPSGFFNIVRPEVAPSKNKEDKILPINWSNEVLSGKKKAVVKLAKKSRR